MSAEQDLTTLRTAVHMVADCDRNTLTSLDGAAVDDVVRGQYQLFVLRQDLVLCPIVQFLGGLYDEDVFVEIGLLDTETDRSMGLSPTRFGRAKFYGEGGCGKAIERVNTIGHDVDLSSSSSWLALRSCLLVSTPLPGCGLENRNSPFAGLFLYQAVTLSCSRASMRMAADRPVRPFCSAYRNNIVFVLASSVIDTG